MIRKKTLMTEMTSVSKEVTLMVLLIHVMLKTECCNSTPAFFSFFPVLVVHKTCAKLISARNCSLLKGGAPSSALPAADWDGPAFPKKSLLQVSALPLHHI